MEAIPRPDLGLPGIWYGAGNAEIHLIETPEGADVGSPPAKTNPLANHVAFAIDDYEKVREMLESRAVETLALGAERGQMWVQDPDGNVIEFIVRSA